MSVPTASHGLAAFPALPAPTAISGKALTYLLLFFRWHHGPSNHTQMDPRQLLLDQSGTFLGASGG